MGIRLSNEHGRKQDRGQGQRINTSRGLFIIRPAPSPLWPLAVGRITSLSA